MAEGARVLSFEALRAFRIFLVKFAEVADVALGDAESEMRRTLVWLETEQSTYWTNQLRVRMEDVVKARDAVRNKKLFKSPTGNTPSAVAEEKILAKAIKRMEEAQQKIHHVKVYTSKLTRELLLYQGQAQNFATVVHSDIPVATAKLDAMLRTLEEYARLAAPDSPMPKSEATSGAAGPGGGMGRKDSGEMPAIVDWADLRSRTPDSEKRATATALGDEGTPPQWTTPRLGESEREKIKALRFDPDAPKDDQKIVMQADIWSEAKIYLHRVIGSPEDTGWFIGPADGNVKAALVSCTVAQMLAARPDLRELFTLSGEFLVVIDGGGVKALIDPIDQDLWAEAAGEETAEAQSHGEEVQSKETK